MLKDKYNENNNNKYINNSNGISFCVPYKNEIYVETDKFRVPRGKGDNYITLSGANLSDCYYDAISCVLLCARARLNNHAETIDNLICKINQLKEKIYYVSANENYDNINRYQEDYIEPGNNREHDREAVLIESFEISRDFNNLFSDYPNGFASRNNDEGNRYYKDGDAVDIFNDGNSNGGDDNYDKEIW